MTDATYTKEILRESEAVLIARVFRDGEEIAQKPFYGGFLMSINTGTYQDAHEWADSTIRLDAKQGQKR